ncbi:MAG: AAA family ATPase [Flavipsychrobacter sp.]|nr:AAA family ATPase [Flavipsychrobacter sp.]
MALPLNERVAKGVTMVNFSLVFNFRELPPSPWDEPIEFPLSYIDSAQITCDKNISKFKEGSKVILCNRGHNFKMEIKEDSVDSFILEPQDFHKYSCYIERNNYPKNNWELREDKSDATEKMLTKTAEVLSNDNSKLSRIDNILNGRAKNFYSSNTYDIANLNNSQKNALSNAVNSSDFCIIQGPPGTGKTETIANMVKVFLEQGKKVFVTAPTHTAINNCLNAISKRIQDKSKVIKIGDRPQNKELADNSHVSTKASLAYPTYQNSVEFHQHGIVIGATPYSVCYDATKKLRYWEFDVCIVDEASQLSIPLSLAAMSRSNKYIFVGDHKQLDPIVPQGTESEMFSESIFSRLARIYPNEINLLNVSYRLNKSLISIPNTLFYNDKLESSPRAILDSKHYECQYHANILNNDPHILVLHNEFDGISDSKYEAVIVTNLVSDLARNGAKLSEIGIMTPYRAQVRTIRRELKNRFPKMTKDHFKMLFIDTVDSMQGQERDYVIYSLANSHPLESMKRLDFFYSPNRLNVAITRAKKKCFVIGNYKVFDMSDINIFNHSEYQEIKKSLMIFDDYYHLSTKITLSSDIQSEW